MAIEDRVAALVADYESGLYTRGEISNSMLALVTATNIEEVVQAVPDEWREELVRLLRRVSGYGQLISVDGSIYRYETEPDPARRAEMIADLQRERALADEHFESVVRPAIREWVRTQG